MHKRLIIVIVSAMVLSARASVAQESGLSVELTPDESFWSGERVAQAKPMPIGTVSSPQKDVGAAKLLFSSSRVFPQQSLTSYPYSAVGKLLIGDGAGGSIGWCTAAVVQRRLVLTAGHCVYDAENQRFFAAFRFVPAYDRGNEPLGHWDAVAAFVTTTWATGRGKFPNAADYALVVLGDSGAGAVAERVGSFSIQLKALASNHLTMLGYPSNLDDGERMHRVDSQNGKADKRSNTVPYGSDMGQGSSGGPWIQNFGEVSDGQAPGSPVNTIVGVTSFVAANLGFKVEGASIPDSRLLAIYQMACGQADGNCQ